MGDLVRQGELFIKTVQMADRGVNVDRLDRIAPGEMDAVEILRQLDEVAKAVHEARDLAPLKIPVIRRRGDIAKDDMLAAHRQGAVGVARGDGEFRRRAAHHLHHEILVHADGFAIDDAARLPEDRDRLGVQEADADLRQDAHRALVDGVHTILVQRFDGPVGVTGDAPGHLVDGPHPGPFGMARPAARTPASLFVRHPVLRCCCRQHSASAGRLRSIKRQEQVVFF